MSTDTHEPDWELNTECHGLGNWHAVIDNGRQCLRLPGYESQLAAMAAGCEAIQRRTIKQETTCRENE